MEREGEGNLRKLKEHKNIIITIKVIYTGIWSGIPRRILITKKNTEWITQKNVEYRVEYIEESRRKQKNSSNNTEDYIEDQTEYKRMPSY